MTLGPACDAVVEAKATVLGAVRDAGPVVRLSYGSLRRSTSGASPVLVAENGSDEEARAFLSAQPGIRLFSVEERMAELEEERRDASELIDSLDSRLARFAATLTVGERRLLTRARRHVEPTSVPTADQMAEHGWSLDWLFARVTTPYVVLVDADLEFTRLGWLTELVTMMDSEALDLLGFLEPARHPVRRRLATHLLVLRTQSISGLGTSFRPLLKFDDTQEAAAWFRAPHARNLATSAFSSYPSARFYDTAARVFESAVAAGLRWRPLKSDWRPVIRHLRHLSWSAYVTDEYDGAEDLRRHRSAMIEYATSRCVQLGIPKVI